MSMTDPIADMLTRILNAQMTERAIVALPIINFTQFVNQVQFGEVAIALNAKVAQTSFAHVNVNRLKGKKVTFTAAFTRSSAPAPLVTPITIRVAK